MAGTPRASTPAAAAPSSTGAYRAVFFRAAASGRSAARRPGPGWPAGSGERAAGAGGAGRPAWAGDAWWSVIGCSPWRGVMAVFWLSVAGPGVRTGVSLVALPAGVHGQTWTRDPDKMATRAAARMAAPGGPALAWSGPGRFPGEGAGRTWAQAGSGAGGRPGE